jgi:hypothetical protein
MIIIRIYLNITRIPILNQLEKIESKYLIELVNNNKDEISRDRLYELLNELRELEIDKHLYTDLFLYKQTIKTNILLFHNIK